MKAGGVLGNMLSYLQFSAPVMKSARKLCHRWPPLMWLSSQQGFQSLSIFKQGLEDKRKHAALLFHCWAATTWWNWNGINKTMDLVEGNSMDERLGFVWVCQVVRGSSSWGTWVTSKGTKIFDCIMKEYVEGAASLITSTTSITLYLLHINAVTAEGTRDNKKLVYFAVCPPTKFYLPNFWLDDPHLHIWVQICFVEYVLFGTFWMSSTSIYSPNPQIVTIPIFTLIDPNFKTLKS